MSQSISANSLNSISTIIKRLEAATSRLEDLATASSFNAAPFTTGQSASAPTSAPAPPPPPPPPPPPAAAEPADERLELVTEYENRVIKGPMKSFVQFTEEFAGDAVKKQVAVVEKMFDHIKTILLMAAMCKNPSQEEFAKVLAPFNEGINAVNELKKGPRCEWDYHAILVAEGAMAVSWVTILPKPSAYIKETIESVQYYNLRILREYKDKDPRHAEWVKSFITVLDALRKYVGERHTDGLVWNSKGIPISEFKLSASASGGAAVPPPPPPPPPPSGAAPTPAASSNAGGAAAVFAELNRGEEVTKGLRKVDRSEMTHKNPELRASSVVPSSVGASSKKPVRPAKPAALAGKKPSKFALEGNKWVIEYYENDRTLMVNEADSRQTVSLYGCKNVTVQIKCKVNALTIVNCTKTSVLIDSVISSVSITNSPSFEIQVTGTCPTIQLDSTDSGQIYLSPSCLGVEIMTAKCSSINVTIPTEGDDIQELPVPEMLKTVINDGKLVTTIVEHAG